MGKRTEDFYREAKEKFPETLKKVRGFILMACQMVGINRTTYHRWLEDDPDFADKCKQAMEYSCAFMESKWLENINKGSQAAIDKWLKYKGKQFGYTEEVTVVGTIDQKPMSEEDLRLLEIYNQRQSSKQHNTTE